MTGAAKIGDPRMPERFWSKVSIDPNGCWIWQGTISHKGYGQWTEGSKRYPAHRIAYERLTGNIPPDLVCDHLCRVRECVNPAHIEPITNGENIRRGTGPGPTRNTHCRRGHELTPENVYIAPKRGWRSCLACKKAKAQEWHQRRKEARSATNSEAVSEDVAEALNGCVACLEGHPDPEHVAYALKRAKAALAKLGSRAP